MLIGINDFHLWFVIFILLSCNKELLSNGISDLRIYLYDIIRHLLLYFYLNQNGSVVLNIFSIDGVTISIL